MKYKLLRITNFLTKQIPGQIGQSSLSVDPRYPKEFDIVFDEKQSWEIIGAGLKGSKENMWPGKIFNIGECKYKVVKYD